MIWLPETIKPFGNPVAEKVYGAMPPVAASKAVYAAPTMPEGSEVVVMVSVGGGWTMESGSVACALALGVALSVTVMVTLPLNVN